jgi:hypothetical protein
MKHLLATMAIAATLAACDPHQMGTILGPANPGLSNDEVIAGLKEALNNGARMAADRAGATDGFWANTAIRIPFPSEAIAVRNTLLDLGIRQPVEEFERTLNRAAETAAKEAVPVFVDAITGMSVQDGFAILRGGPHAATDFLRQRTTEALHLRFRPVVERATSAVSLTSAWRPVASAYNTATLLTGGRAVEPDLDGYVTERALEGLFTLVAQEEERIRRDPMARTSDLLRKVFAAQ